MHRKECGPRNERQWIPGLAFRYPTAQTHVPLPPETAARILFAVLPAEIKLIEPPLLLTMYKRINSPVPPVTTSLCVRGVSLIEGDPVGRKIPLDDSAIWVPRC
jgi:hypothetical protein